jgi:hypothetical protein
MEIDNDRNATRAKVILISVPFVMLIGSSLLAIFQIIFTWIPTLISGLLVIFGWSITVILKLKSVKFRFSEEMITVLYYPISPMTSNFKRIDIASDKLAAFEIRSGWLGFKKELVLHENINGEEAPYPPVVITLCGKEAISQIREYLSAYCSAGTSS